MDNKKLLLIPLISFGMLTACTNNFNGVPKTDSIATILTHPIPSDPMQRAKQFREDIWQAYLALKPYNNGYTYQNYMTPIVERYIPAGSDFKEAELLLRNAGFEVDTDIAHAPRRQGVYSGGVIIGRLFDNHTLFRTDIAVSISVIDDSYKTVNKATVSVISSSP